MPVLHAHRIQRAFTTASCRFTKSPHNCWQGLIHFHTRRQLRHEVCSQCATQGVQGLSTPGVPPMEDVGKDAEWISGIISLWLNEEWTYLEVHTDVGAAAADAYIGARDKGADDMGDLVLELSSQLTSFNFDETFVGPFDVANKVVEFLMMRDGIDVCCTSDDDLTLFQEYNESFKG